MVQGSFVRVEDEKTVEDEYINDEDVFVKAVVGYAVEKFVVDEDRNIVEGVSEVLEMLAEQMTGHSTPTVTGMLPFGQSDAVTVMVEVKFVTSRSASTVMMGEAS